MKTITMAICFALLSGTGAFAQTATSTTTQQVGAVGASGNAAYPVQVTGANGIIYNCRPDITQSGGAPVRVCQQANAPAFQGTLGAAAPAALGALVLVAALGGSDNAISTTTTTN